MTVKAVPTGNQQTAIKNRTAAMENPAAMENDRTAAAAPTKLKTSDELRGNNSIRNIDIEQLFRSGRSIGSNHGDDTGSEHSSVPFSIRRRTTTNIPANPGVEEIATWFQQIIGIRTSEEALAFAQKAVHQFGLQSTAEVEAQFRPPETTSRRSSPEWITVAHKQKYRPSTTIPPLEGTTGTRGTSPNRFEALSYKGSDTNSSGTPISSTTQHGPPNKGSQLNEQSAIVNHIKTRVNSQDVNTEKSSSAMAQMQPQIKRKQPSRSGSCTTTNHMTTLARRLDSISQNAPADADKESEPKHRTRNSCRQHVKHTQSSRWKSQLNGVQALFKRDTHAKRASNKLGQNPPPMPDSPIPTDGTCHPAENSKFTTAIGIKNKPPILKKIVYSHAARPLKSAAQELEPCSTIRNTKKAKSSKHKARLMSENTVNYTSVNRVKHNGFTGEAVHNISSEKPNNLFANLPQVKNYQWKFMKKHSPILPKNKLSLTPKSYQTGTNERERRQDESISLSPARPLKAGWMSDPTDHLYADTTVTERSKPQRVSHASLSPAIHAAEVTVTGRMKGANQIGEDGITFDRSFGKNESSGESSSMRKEGCNHRQSQMNRTIDTDKKQWPLYTKTQGKTVNYCRKRDDPSHGIQECPVPTRSDDTNDASHDANGRLEEVHNPSHGIKECLAPTRSEATNDACHDGNGRLEEAHDPSHGIQENPAATRSEDTNDAHHGGHESPSVHG